MTCSIFLKYLLLTFLLVSVSQCVVGACLDNSTFAGKRCWQGLPNWPNNMGKDNTYNTSICFQNNDGTFNTCINSFPTTAYTYAGKVLYTGTTPNVNITVNRMCGIDCPTCIGINNPDYNCTSCRTGLYLWIGYNRCKSYCPSFAISITGFTINDIGQYPSTGNQCAQCDARCNFCNGPLLTNCFSCRNGYYWVGDYTQCMNRYNTTPYGPQTTCYNTQCYSVQGQCPPYYFYIAQTIINDPTKTFTTWSNAVCQNNGYDTTCITYRRTNTHGVCYLCDSHCLTCTGLTQLQCLTCSRYNYLWAQKPYYCQQTCPRGVYTSNAGDWVGQFINQTAVNVTTGIGDRQCYLCDSNCRWCRYSAQNCIQCKDTHYLIDLVNQCKAQYITPNNCSICQNTTYDMCNAASFNTNKRCVSACPTYMYFALTRTAASTSQWSVQNTIYASYTSQAAANQSYVNGNRNAAFTTQAYRTGTNLCMLCDYRCLQCTGPYNNECSKCRSGFYKWMTATICDTTCPAGQYQANDQPYPVNQTQCRYCSANCILCTYSKINCTSCVGANYAFSTGGIVAFLYTYNSSYHQCLNTCPAETVNPSTIAGYYGSFLTLTCLQCPSPCSNCNIDIIRNRYPDISCGADSACSVGLVCTSCLSGYINVGGKCIGQNNCREYAYNSVSGGTFSSSNCVCLDGYSSSGALAGKCDIRCHISCKTCTGTAVTNCVTCYTGSVLDANNQCVIDSTKSLYTYTWVVDGPLTNIQASSTSYILCGAQKTIFGYQDQDFNAATNTNTLKKYFGYTYTIPSLNYYAIKIKIGLLFVDQYNTKGQIYVARDTNTSNPQWMWNFDTQTAYGQQLCGTNKMDYILFATATLNTRNQSTETFFIKSNQDIMQTTLSTQVHWGIVGFYVSVLSCDPVCSRCTGPSSTQCLACATTGYVAVNGVCLCDIANNYYKWSNGICNIGCPTGAGWFRDNYTRSCVQPPTNSNCTAPSRFGDSMGTVGYGTCVAACPSGLFATYTYMKCTTDCWVDGPSAYKYSGGSSGTCQTICPPPYIKDPSTHTCVLKCPANYYLQIQNSTTDRICVTQCPTGYQFDGLQACITDCPGGTFKYQTNPTNPTLNHKKCVNTCINSYGDPNSDSCTLSCPSPLYGDPRVWMCVATCSYASDYMQVAISNSNRTCVPTCQAGQYGNPYTMSCSSVTTACPDGFYADSHTHMCQFNCTTAGEVGENSTKACQTSCNTGFAHWESRKCVAICPSNPVMFGYLPTKICVYSCNYTLTQTYGDAQANRTCVQTCTASPTPTYGQNSTSLCTDKCSGSTQFGDGGDIYRRCVTSCSSVPQRYAQSVSRECVLTCPISYYGDVVVATGGICAKACQSPNFGDPITHKCQPTCSAGYYGDPNGNRMCVGTCPRYWFGMNATTNRVCVQTCDTGYWGDIQTSLCYNVKTMCSNNTYADAQKKLCVQPLGCTLNTFADPFTKGCQSACTNSYFADSHTRSCVPICSDQFDQYGQSGVCRYTCLSNQFTDLQANRTCTSACSQSPLALYGMIATCRQCVLAQDCPSGYYGDNNTLLCTNLCAGSLPFGDPISKQCVADCPDGYWGDYDLHLCVQTCNAATYHFADNITGNCQLLCSLGTFGVNVSASHPSPTCQIQCPPGAYGRSTDRLCVAVCGSSFYSQPVSMRCYLNPTDCPDGYYGSQAQMLCVVPNNCQIDALTGKHYFADNSTKLCVAKCPDPSYGDNSLWICVSRCNTTYFGQNSTRLCLSDCSVDLNSYAQVQNNMCVARCSNSPLMHYGQDATHTCVLARDCPFTTAQTFAQNSTQKCVLFCGANQYSDIQTKRCVATCPPDYFSDDSTGITICATVCTGVYRFRQNATRSCVDVCSQASNTYGYSDGDACVVYCPVGFYAQDDADRRCVIGCKTGTWANKQTRVCTAQPLIGCPQNTWADNSTNACEETCDSASGYYGNNATRMCVTACPVGTYAWDLTRVCIDVCPSLLNGYGYFGDDTTLPTRKCFMNCQGANLYRDTATRKCVPDCTYNSTYKTYKDPTTLNCQSICSSYPQQRYADNNLHSCQLTCAGSLIKDDVTQSCVSVCTGVYEPTTDKCVDKCPTQSSLGEGLFANMDATLNTCVKAVDCPANTYADTDSRTCVGTCPTGYYSSGKYCVYFCPIDYYSDSTTHSCVSPMSCPSNTYADNQTQSCVSKCIGTYGDPTTKRCVIICEGSLFGDSYTRECVTNCSQGFKANQITRTCTSDCGSAGTYLNVASGSCIISCSAPYYQDDSIMACVEVCPASPLLYASIDSSTGKRKCVQTCQPGKWYDMLNRICVDSCPTGTNILTANSSCVITCPAPQYYQLAHTCVTNCSSDPILQFGDDTTRKCVSTCPPGSYSNPVTYICTQQCPLIPVEYYISVSESKCTTACPQGTFADPRSYVCVTECSINPRMYAQDVNNVCVDVCPFVTNTFADPTTGKCVLSCPSGYFADSRDRLCKTNCSYLFSDSTLAVPACVENCSSGTYADQITYTCLSNCPLFYFKFPAQNRCVSGCPFGYYLNPTLSLCVTGSNCPSTLPYADNLTRKCTSACSQQQYGYLAVGTSMGGSCVLYCPNNQFSNPITRTCMISCPDGLFADTDSYTCNQKCTYDKLMNQITNQCVSSCSAAYSLYADLFDRKCVTQCDTAVKDTFADDLTRNCQSLCTGAQYGDPVTGKCVGAKQCSTGYVSDWRYKRCMIGCNDGAYQYLGQCIPECPTLTDNVYGTREGGNKCVTAMNCPNGTYGDPVLKQCVQFCPLQSDTFANQDTKQCLVTCLSPLFGQIKTRFCMPACPNVPKMYGDPTNRRCVYQCQSPYFADQISNLCVLGCPSGYFSYAPTSTCVKQCPQGSFANTDNLQCQFTCSIPYYGDIDSRKCIPQCLANTFGDIDNNRECHPSCTGNPNTFAQNTTRQCTSTCLTGYSNPRTKQCIAICTAGYYGYSHVCYTDCPTTVPQVYADNQTHTCVEVCPTGTYADSGTNRCVKICPIENGTYGDPLLSVCDVACSGTYYADYSTRMCVPVCPQVPQLYGLLPQQICVLECPNNLFADSISRMCRVDCPSGTYADNITYRCQQTCSSQISSPRPLYGQNITNTCVEYCWADRDMYADNSTRTCVYQCALHTFADPTTHTCVNTCPSSYYAVNDTRRCQPVCPDGTFANQFLRICVAVCPIDPVYYGDPADHTCKTECPAGSYGNQLDQQCVYDINGVSTCPPNYYADTWKRICVQICSRELVEYGDPYYKKCMPTCSPSLFYDDSTMRCVAKCPTYPNYYGNLVGMRCIWPCPNGTYADDQSKVCLAACPPNSYADDSTWRCVQKCPYSPLTYGDSLSWTCVPVCPSGYFSDNSTHKCVLSCPSLTQHTFADNNTGSCIKVCPNSTYADYPSGYCVSQCYGSNYTDNTVNMCVSTCSKYPPLYADPSTHNCVSTCPAFYYIYQPTRACVLDCPDPTMYRQNSTGTCVSECNWLDNSYADDLTRYCVVRCSADSWAENIKRTCVGLCPIWPIVTFADNTSQSCVSRCPGSTLGYNTSRMCVNACPSTQFTYLQNSICVAQCPDGYYAQYSNRICISACPYPQFGDPSTKFCVSVCPLDKLLFADNSTGTCVASCPPFTYADRKSISCVSVCPDADPALSQIQTYAADYSGQCVQICDPKYYSFLPTKSCITRCPDPYYNENITHTCKPCPSTCTACPIPQFCTSCIVGYWWENGNCVQFCSQGYYGNYSSMKCVPSAMCAPYYGVNSTRLCTVSCPSDSYQNQQYYRCDACFYTCLTCTYWDYCLTCNTSISMMFNNMCYRYCQITDSNNNGIVQPYYDVDNKTCVDICKDGTYLQALYCKKCASQCQTCSITATNCTRCKDGLYAKNYICVAECNNGYKPTTTRECVYCGSSCGNQLTFKSNTTQIKGQNIVFVTFSDNIRIMGDPNLIFLLVQTARRRMLAAGYTIYLVDDHTIKIVLDSSMNYNKYTLKIIQPQKILDEQGNMPDKVRDLVIIDLTQTYDMTLENAPNRFSNYFAFLAVVCVFSFLFDIQFMKFLQLIYVHYFIAISLPPQFAKVLMAFRYSTLYYLPTLYPVPQPMLRQTIPTKIYDSIGDYSFLRNGGFVFTPLLVIFIIWVIMKILSVPEINRFKNIRVWCDQQLHQKFKFAVQIQWLNIVFLNSVFFILLQTKDYTKYDQFSTASIVISILFLVFIVLCLVYIAYRIISFFKQYPRLSKNLSKAADIILKESQFNKLNTTNIFLFEMKKIDLRNLYYPKVNNQNVMPFRNIYKFGRKYFSCLFVTFGRSIILSILIVFAKSPLLQMGLCIPLNYACLLYFIKYRPYSFKFMKRRVRNYIAIFHQIGLIVFEVLMLILGALDTYVKSNSVKQSFSYGIIAFLFIICTLSFIYYVFRISVQIYRRIWFPLTATEIFKRNFPKKWAQIHGQKSKKFMKNFDPNAKQALRALIKSYKKYKSHLRPTQDQRHYPQPQIGYKITYFDRDTSSMNTTQKRNRSKNRKMLQQIFKQHKSQLMKEQQTEYPQNEQPLAEDDWGFSDFQEYEQQIKIRVKDLANYVNNPGQYLMIRGTQREEDPFDELP